MIQDKKAFEYQYCAPSESERKIIESIRGDYAQRSGEQKDFAKLCALHKKVRVLPKLFAALVGTAGVLIFGLGMSLILVWQLILIGVAVCAAGAAILVAAYPIYKRFCKASKDKYSAEILSLCDTLLQNNVGISKE